MLTPYLLQKNREFDSRCKNWYRLKRWIGGSVIKRCEAGHDVDDGAIPDFGPYFRDGFRWDVKTDSFMPVSDSDYIVKTHCHTCGSKILPEIIRYIPGIVEKCFVNNEFKNADGHREEIPLLLPPYALGCLFTILYTGDVSPTGEKNSLIIQPRSTYKTLVVSIALFLYTVNNHQDRNVMFVVFGVKQSNQTLLYLKKHYNECRDAEYQDIIKKYMRPKISTSKDKGVFFLDGTRIVVYVTYTERVAETLRSFHGSFIFVDECAQIEWKYISSIKHCLNLGGRIAFTTTPKVNDWTKDVVTSIIINKNTYVDGDDEYIKNLLRNKNIDPKAYSSWSLVRIPLKEIIENRGPRPDVVARSKWTWDAVNEEVAGAITPAAISEVRSDLFLEWVNLEGGLIFPNGLKDVYADYLPGVNTLEAYTNICAGIDFAESDCNTVLSIFGTTMLKNNSEMIRLIHVERITQSEFPHEQIPQIIDACVKYHVQDLVFDNAGSGSTIYGVLKKMSRDTPDIIEGMRVHAGRWGNVKIKSNDYDTLKILEITRNIQVPDPSYLLTLRYLPDDEYKDMKQYAIEIRNANDEFHGLSWKYINNKTTLAVKKPKYADYPDSFAFAVRFLVSSKKLTEAMLMTSVREQTGTGVTDAPILLKKQRFKAFTTNTFGTQDRRMAGRPNRIGSVRSRRIYENKYGRRNKR